MCRLQLVICIELVAVCCFACCLLLVVVGCLLIGVRCSLLFVRCSLSVVCCVLFVSCLCVPCLFECLSVRLLLLVRYLMFGVCCA